MSKNLITPEFKVKLKEFILRDGIEVECFSSRESKTDWCSVVLTSQLQKLISYEDLEPAAVMLGYDEDYDNLITGYAQKKRTDYWKEILIKDDMIKLERTEVRDTFEHCEPQDIVRFILTRAGVENYVLSDVNYSTRDIVVLNKLNGISAIKAVGSAWNMDTDFFFRDGVFYWGCKPPQDLVYILEEGRNILSLKRYGTLFEIETLGVPWIHHSQVVRVIHSKYSGLVNVEKTIVKSDVDGRVRMYIYFKGGGANV